MIFDAALPTLTVSVLAADATLLHKVYPYPLSGGGEESRLDGRFLIDRGGGFSGSSSSSSKLVRVEAYPAVCFMRSKKDEPDAVVESLLRFVPVRDSDRS